MMDDPANGLGDNYNAWQTDGIFVDRAPAITDRHRIHIFDFTGSGQYTLHFTMDTIAPSAAWRTFATLGSEIGPDGSIIGTEMPLEVSPDDTSTEPRRSGGVYCEWYSGPGDSGLTAAHMPCMACSVRSSNGRFPYRSIWSCLAPSPRFAVTPESKKHCSSDERNVI